MQGLEQAVAEKYQDKIKSLETEVEKLKNIILFLKRDQFGSKSEQIENIEEQFLFNEIEAQATAAHYWRQKQ